MKISIIVPAYNEEEHIEKCIKALLEIKKNSIYQIEIIVCDNNSTDNTSKIIQQFPEVLLVHEKKQGTNYARQAALDFASGDIIACIDADCIPNTDWVARGAHYFSDPKTISVAGLCVFSREYPYSWIVTEIQRKIFPILHLVSRFFGGGGMMLGGNVFVRTYVLRSIGGFDTSFVFWGDDAQLAKTLSRYGGKMFYSTNVRVTTSSRRYKKNGLLKTLFDYTYIWIKVVILKEKL